jgi:hypothetical protein
MKRLSTFAVLVAISAGVLSPMHARAEDGRIAAGIFGGLALVTLLGAATAPGYYGPAPVYVEPAPVYVERPASYCYWTHGEPVWDGWRWVSPRVRVCD